MAQSRFRTERCAAHGIAVGLCTVGTCKGSAEAKKAPREHIELIKPLRCSGRCKQERGDVIRRGEFSGRKQRAWCDGCWADKLARDAAQPKTQAELLRAAKKSGRYPLRSESTGQTLE